MLYVTVHDFLHTVTKYDPEWVQCVRCHSKWKDWLITVVLVARSSNPTTSTNTTTATNTTVSTKTTTSSTTTTSANTTTPSNPTTSTSTTTSTNKTYPNQPNHLNQYSTILLLVLVVCSQGGGEQINNIYQKTGHIWWYQELFSEKV